MRGLARGLPEQLTAGFELGSERAPPSKSVRSVVVSGMGGSGIAGQVLRPLIDQETSVRYHVTDGPSIPQGVGPKDLVVLLSYSGNTWETLGAYRAAAARGASRVVITSGGELGSRARRDRVGVVTVPPGLPPRAAFGYLFGGLLGVVDNGFLRTNADRLQAAARYLRYRQPKWAGASGLPLRLARRMGTRTPTIYGDLTLFAPARRWKTQIEENAKRLAHADLLPEAFHNAIVGWDAISREGAREVVAVFLDWPGSEPAVRDGADYLGRLIVRRGAVAETVDVESEDRLVALLSAISLGDHVSLALAEEGGVDPFPYEAITRLKHALARR
ncbi:MAG: SIS domain-containing protein [Thermoplasmata archaeon]